MWRAGSPPIGPRFFLTFPRFHFKLPFIFQDLRHRAIRMESTAWMQSFDCYFIWLNNFFCYWNIMCHFISMICHIMFTYYFILLCRIYFLAQDFEMSLDLCYLHLPSKLPLFFPYVGLSLFVAGTFLVDGKRIWCTDGKVMITKKSLKQTKDKRD